jgi:RNA polymerase sigma-70 factor (ECF subfamily)
MSEVGHRPRHPHRCARLSAGEQVAALRNAARGELAAIGLLYDLFSPGLVRLAIDLLEEPSEAVDVVHDVFIRACERAAQFDPRRGSVWAWLSAMTVHAAHDRNRRRRVRRRLHRRLRAGEPRAVELERDVMALGSASRSLAELPSSQREVLVASFGEDVSYATLAARNRVSLGTLKSRAARGLDALRAAFR